MVTCEATAHDKTRWKSIGLCETILEAVLNPAVDETPPPNNQVISALCQPTNKRRDRTCKTDVKRTSAYVLSSSRHRPSSDPWGSSGPSGFGNDSSFGKVWLAGNARRGLPLVTDWLLSTLHHARGSLIGPFDNCSP